MSNMEEKSKSPSELGKSLAERVGLPPKRDMLGGDDEMRVWYGWGWPGFTAQVHCGSYDRPDADAAGDGRDSPLKYTRGVPSLRRR